MKIRIGAAIVVLMLTTGLAFGSATTFFGQDLNGNQFVRLGAHPNADTAHNQFFANLVGVGTEDFEGVANGTPAPLALVFPGAGTATLTGSGNISTITAPNTNGVGRYPISGNNYWEVTGAFQVTFSQPVAAFGFYATDIGDFGGHITLTLAGGATETITVPNNTTSAADGSVLYFGFIEPLEFTSITFGNTASGTDFFGFDDMTVGSLQQVQPVPEPASLTLLASALCMVGAFGRRLVKR